MLNSNPDVSSGLQRASPSSIEETVIAAPDNLPTELKLDKYIDRDLQFDKAFLEPIKSITNIIGWEIEKRSTLEDFFT